MSNQSMKANGGTKKLTKRELSSVKEGARVKRKKAADERKAKSPKKDHANHISVVKNADGTFTFKGRSLSPTADKNAALAPYNKAIWNYGVQLRAYPTDEQASQIDRTIGCARFVRNNYLSARIAYFDETRKTLKVTDYKKGRLQELKNGECSWLKDVDKFALEAAVEHVDDAYKNFFDGRADFPKFVSKYKSAGNKYSTKFTNNNIQLFVNRDGVPVIKLPKIGDVRVIIPRGKTVDSILPHGARITKATVSRVGKAYYISLVVEMVVDKIEPITSYKPNRLISMDMGLHQFCDYSNGDGNYKHIENPRWIRKSAKKLRRLQKKASRCQYDEKTHKGSNNWYKAQEKVAKLQRKIANQRKDFQHKLSRKIADSCEIFVCEDLNIRGLLRNRHLAKEISSVSWGQFLTFVKYKLERKGGLFIQVSRWFPSSKLCSCGYKYDLSLNERWWICPKCHSLHDRDDHAVDNLRKEGIRILAERGIFTETIA